ncbi:MAG: TIR domain-containing protein [Bacteroidota bacterium]
MEWGEKEKSKLKWEAAREMIAPTARLSVALLIVAMYVAFGHRLISIRAAHAWKHGHDYDRLVEMLNNAPLFRWSNYSVSRDHPLDLSDAGLLAALDRKIAQVHAVVVIAGWYVNWRPWLKDEIGLALDRGKPIIGIRPRGETRLPPSVQENAATIVGWTTAGVVKAIRKHAL